MNRRFKRDGVLILLFVLVCLSSASLTYFDNNGFLTPDSTGYLARAQNMLAGRGYVQMDLLNYGVYARYTEQPPAYSFCISVLCRLIIPGQNIFLAAKLFNVLCVAMLLLFVRGIASRCDWVLSLLILSVPFLHVFTYIWSEALFIPLLLFFVFELEAFLRSSRVLLIRAFLLGGIGVALFTTRYIGLFVVAVMVFYSCKQFFRKDFKRAFYLLSAGLTISLFATGYFYINYKQTGNLAGPRIGPGEPFSIGVISAFKEFLTSMNLLSLGTGSFKLLILFIATAVFQVSGISFLWYCLRKREMFSFSRQLIKQVNLPSVFILVGATYFVFIIGVRLIVAFDKLGYRLLSPGIFCLYAALLLYLENHLSGSILSAFRRFWVLIISLSFMIGFPLYLMDNASATTYILRRSELAPKYGELSAGTLVACGNMHLTYLRPDLQITQPRRPPYSAEFEKMKDFLSRIQKSPAAHIAIEIRSVEEMTEYDKSVALYMREHADQVFVYLR